MRVVTVPAAIPLLLCAAVLVAGAGAQTRVSSRPFGKTPDGVAVEAFTLSDGRAEATVLTYGGVVQSLRVPDRKGTMADVVLGFDTLEGYGTEQSALRVAHRALCEPHRRRQVFAEWRRLPYSHQQQRQRASRRAARLRQAGLEGEAHWQRRRAGAHQSRRRPGISRNANGSRALHAQRR